MKEIDLNNWDLAEQYKWFSTYSTPFYGITTKLDVTNVYNFAKRNNISFYFCFGHLVNTAVRQIEEFNIRDVNGKLMVDNHKLVSFTCKNSNERKYRFVNVPYCDNVIEFCKIAKEIDMGQTTLFSKNNLGDDFSVFLSCLPWINFTMVSNPQTNNTTDYIPRIVWDKYEEINNKKILNFGVEVNHAVVDGYAISKFVLKVSELINKLK